MPLPRCPRPLHPAIPGLAAADSVAIVGNAPEMGDHARAIDAADRVIRVNNAAGLGGRAGSRTTHLALVNRGGQMRAWLADPAAFLDRPAVRAAGAFLLTYPALPEAEVDAAGEQVCWTREALALLAPLGRPVHVLPEALHEAARRALAPGTIGRPNPSTGLLVALAVVRARPPGSAPVDAYGFGFAGWPGHPWAAERCWFAAAHAAGRLRLHPLPNRPPS